MASQCTQRNATLPISFFKVILKTNLQSIKIPNIFTANYGGGLPNPLFMKLPNGTEWKVIWEKDSGEIWLREGWKEFVEHYSLDHGHFVFFKYEGTSEVRVYICDQSGVEIDYPCGTGDGKDK
ncbi:B3 domain-containing protein At1g49475-like [Vigna umbellata]|uniref:B3 domain-containing protein At1g49475-like n=1 Tax=Vigna umbellata TaxID=87088 RepID=UPI001F5FA350|nr:B3 domain-containing protein At1g49475-like [Vigna umbellata]